MNKKIYIKENQMPLLEYYYTPDQLYFNDEDFGYDDGDAIPFICFTNLECEIGDYSETHSAQYEKLPDYEYGDDDIDDEGNFIKRDILLKGRIWTRSNLIAYWDSISFNPDLIIRLITSDLFDYFDMEKPIYIVYGGEIYEINDYINKFVTDEDEKLFDEGYYLKSEYWFYYQQKGIEEKKRKKEEERKSKEEERIKQIHLMKQDMKRKALEGFRKAKENKLGKQLSSYDEDGNFKSEMPLAQWRALHSTSESKKNINNLINENIINSYEAKDAYSIRYSVDEPDEEDYDSEYYESYEEFYNDNVSYDIEFYNIDNESLGCAYGLSKDDLDDYFDDDEIIQNIINKEGRKVSGNEYELEDLINTNVDINNFYEVNEMAKRLFYCHDNYYKGLGGYILTDGTLVDFGEAKDHNSISSIDGMTVGKFMSLGNIRIRYNNIDLVQEPTNEQKIVLRKMINSYSDDEIYVDICVYKEGEWYASTVTSAKYVNPRYNEVMGEINRFFYEGLKLKGGYGMYESKHIRENLDLEVKPDEVDLSSFNKRNELNPKIWDDDDTLNSRVRLKLLDIADDFCDFANIKWGKPEDIILTGSICNFNWSDYSDIDLHIVLDFSTIDSDTEMVKEYFDGKKNEWNNEHDELNIFGFNVELYVQDSKEEAISNGIYSLESNEWIKKPNIGNVKSIKDKKEMIKLISSSIMTKIDDIEDGMNSKHDSHNYDELYDNCIKIQDEISRLRKNNLNKFGEFSIGNIIYKVLRRFNYLDKLWDLKTSLYDKINSIT